MKRSVNLFFFILLLSVTTYAQKLDIDWIKGTWAGTGFQPSDNSNWPIRLHYEPSEKLLKIDYPLLGCGGVWKLNQAKKSSVSFTEKLSYGKNKCINGSTVIVNQTCDNFISIGWFSKHIMGIDAFATLERIPPEWLRGVWEGSAYRLDNNSNWTVKLEYYDTYSEIVVTYSTIPCKSKWKLIEYSENRLVFSETITESTRNCINEATIILNKLPNKHIAITWFSKSDKLIATAIIPKRI